MYENKKEKLAEPEIFRKRIFKHSLIGMCVLLVCLFLGVLGYKLSIPEFDWYDSLLNASMILSGMGPVIGPQIVLSKSAKIFASAYALFSGIAFISTITILMAPVVHRFFHKLHLEAKENN